MILPPGSLCSTDETMESGHWAPPLQNRRVSMTFFMMSPENIRAQIILGSVQICLCHPGPRWSGADPLQTHPSAVLELHHDSKWVLGSMRICACGVKSGHGVGELSSLTAPSSSSSNVGYQTRTLAHLSPSMLLSLGHRCGNFVCLNLINLHKRQSCSSCQWLICQLPHRLSNDIS